MDQVLEPYRNAKDERERQQHLDELLTLRAAPMIRQTLRRRLGFYVSAQGINENNQDAEDLFQEAMTRGVQVLTQLQSSSAVDIANFELYVLRLAANIFIDFQRSETPAHTHLKYSLPELLKRHKDFASWKHEGATLCGFASWRNSPKSAFSDQSENLETRLDSFRSLYFADEDKRVTRLAQVVAELFDWISGPVEVDLLVRMIVYLLDVKDQRFESLDDLSPGSLNVSLVDKTQSDKSHVEANELLARLWQAVIQFPTEQRDSFVFGFEDEAGQDLFTVLLAAEIVSWDELANGMGRSLEEVVRLRLQMQMDSVKVAKKLRASRENV